jgi:hypothetical protein
VIKGNYVNNAPNTECIGSPYDLRGKLDGHKVIFYVDFSDCFTVTEWRGAFAAANMSTRFEAAYPQLNGRLKIWKGVDVFTKQ